MSDVKILVSCHKESYVPKVGCLLPIQVGASGKKHVDGMLHDDEGDNISEKNYRYCELTAQYWAWKNLNAEYYGFFHYRRYLSFSDNQYKTDPFNNIKFNVLDDATVNDLCINDAKIEKSVEGYDLILPKPWNVKTATLRLTHNNVYNHYKVSKGHKIEDLDRTIEILSKMHPDYVEDAKSYLNSKYGWFLNIFIMKKALFFGYCEWLFPIIDEFDKERDYSQSTLYECRTPGLLAERLLGIYVTHLLRTEKNIKIKYLQQTMFASDIAPYPSPAFKDNNNVVCFASSDEYAKFLGVALVSLVANSSENQNYDVLLLSNGISEYNKNRLRATVGNRKNFCVRFIESAYLVENRKLAEISHINKTTYLRFAILDYFRNYKKLVYLDCDLVVNADIADLCSTDVNGYALAAVKDTVQAGWCNQLGNTCKEYNEKFLGMSNAFDYFNAGVLVMNLDFMRQKYTSEDLFEIAASKKWHWLDQDVFNSLFNGQVKLLPNIWNVMEHRRGTSGFPEEDAPRDVLVEYLAAVKKPNILHFAGSWTPCFESGTDELGLFWKYAEQSSFYEELLLLAADNLKNIKKKTAQKRGTPWNRFISLLLPRGSRRREVVKRIVGRFVK